MSKFVFNYTIKNAESIFAQDIPTRELAREELRNIKASGFKDAQIIREEYIKIAQRQVR